MRADAPDLGTDVLMLEGLEGTEGVSAPFAFKVDLVSEQEDIDALAVVRKPLLLTITLHDGSKRFIHGLVNRFRQLGQKDDLTAYSAEIVPWLSMLGYTRDCRIYQNKSVPDIIEDVFGRMGWTDFDFRINRQVYTAREYCVQYRETHLNFVSRLLEEEGIWYFFEHSKSGHKLIMTDTPTSFDPCPGAATARFHPQAPPDEDVVREIQREHAAYIGAVTLRDYDFKQPNLTLQAEQTGDGAGEIYDYPGGYFTAGAGDRYARVRIEAEEATQQTVHGKGTFRAFTAGYTFELEDHYRSDINSKYTLLEVKHTARINAFRAWNVGVELTYSNEFIAMPTSLPYRPPRRTPVPVVHGTQTALVTGPAGEEIHTDEHGRVKVRFYWDRVSAKDDGSSCWIRVASPWAGKSWGNIWVPRIGNEVVVDFLEGDPDRPLIIGSVYNDDQAPPYALPSNKATMGVRSRSSKGGGGYNEIILDDRKGNELIRIHAQKDMSTTVENNDTISIGNDRSEVVANNEDVSIGGNRSETVGKTETINIGADRTESVGKNETVSVAANRSLTVGSDDAETVGKNRTLAIGANDEVTIGKERATSVGKEDSLSVGKKLVINVGDEIVIKTGKASIQMKKDGTITIKGKDINLKASGKITGKASSTVTLKGSKIMQN